MDVNVNGGELAVSMVIDCRGFARRTAPSLAGTLRPAPFRGAPVARLMTIPGLPAP
jgi:hypothetical protein